MSERLGAGLIGAGRIGRVHAEHLAFRIPEAELLMVADVSEDAAQACARRCGVPAVVRDHRAVLDNPAVAAVDMPIVAGQIWTLLRGGAVRTTIEPAHDPRLPCYPCWSPRRVHRRKHSWRGEA